MKRSWSGAGGGGQGGEKIFHELSYLKEIGEEREREREREKLW